MTEAVFCCCKFRFAVLTYNYENPKGMMIMKKITALILCLAMVLGLAMPAFAASSGLSFEEELARDLKSLGLFKGVSETDFALGRAPTRIESLVMLVRVLGK